MVGKLLGIGVKALHKRCKDLFGCEWAEFVAARPSPSGSTATLGSAGSDAHSHSRSPTPSATSPPPALPAAHDPSQQGQWHGSSGGGGSPLGSAIGHSAPKPAMLALPAGGSASLSAQLSALSAQTSSDAVPATPSGQHSIPAGGGLPVAALPSLAGWLPEPLLAQLKAPAVPAAWSAPPAVPLISGLSFELTAPDVARLLGLDEASEPSAPARPLALV